MYKQIKNITDYKDPKKGIIVNDSFNNPWILNTGFHKYKNVYNFYNQPQEGQIGSVKSLVNPNNNILWTPDNKNLMEYNLGETNSTTNTDPYFGLGTGFGFDYDYYTDTILTNIGGYYPLLWDVCDCSTYYIDLPVKIEVLDYKLNNKIFFIALGFYKEIYAYDITVQSCTNPNIFRTLGWTKFYFTVVDTVGFIPRPLYKADYETTANSIYDCGEIHPIPGGVFINYGTWKDVCIAYRNPNSLSKSEHSMHVILYKLFNLRNRCTSCSEFPIFIGANFEGDEYIKLRRYYKRFRRKDLC